MKKRAHRAAVLSLLALGAGVAAWAAPASTGHRDPCHLQHACPSDHHTYPWGPQGLYCTSYASERLANDAITVVDSGRTYWCHGSAVAAAKAPGAGRPILASRTRTPGVVNPNVTRATIHRTICVSGWTTTIRPPVGYTNALKLEQMAQYGDVGSPSNYEEDHLISLELGGHPTDPRNLWPEPYPRAAHVDTLENELNAQVCGGSLTLAQAQERESDLKHSHG
jgi:hypothetical protein